MSDIKDYIIQYYLRAHNAFQTGDIARLEELTHLSPFPRGTDGWLGQRWLTTAIETGNPDAVVWVLSKNTEVNYVEDDGQTALKVAIELETAIPQMGELSPEDATQVTQQVIDLLLDAGAKVNQQIAHNWTALHAAALHASPDIVRHLLSRGADPMAYDDDMEPSRPIDYAQSNKRWGVEAILAQAMKPCPQDISDQ